LGGALQAEVTRRAKKVGEFAFMLDDQKFPPVLVDETRRPYIVHVRSDELITALSNRFGLTATEYDVSQIRSEWIGRPPD
jgi:hypothetical protein